MFSGLLSLPSAYTWIKAQRRISASHSDFLMQADTDVNVWGWANLWGLDFGSDPKLIEFSLLDLCHTVLPQQNKCLWDEPKSKIKAVFCLHAFLVFISWPIGNPEYQRIWDILSLQTHLLHHLGYSLIPIAFETLKKNMKSVPWFLVCGMSSYELKSQSYA